MLKDKTLNLTITKVVADYFDKFYEDCLAPLDPLYHKLPKEDPLRKQCWFIFHQFAHMGSRIINYIKKCETGTNMGTFWNFLSDGGGEKIEKYINENWSPAEEWQSKCVRLRRLLYKKGMSDQEIDDYLDETRGT